MNKEPCPFDPPSEPLSSVFAREIKRGRLWRLEEFLDSVDKEGNSVAEEDRKLYEVINKLIRTRDISIRELKDQSEFFKHHEVITDFKQVWNFTNKSLLIEHAMRCMVNEPKIKFIEDMMGGIHPEEFAAIERIVNFDPRSDDSPVRAQLRKEGISDAAIDRILEFDLLSDDSVFRARLRKEKKGISNAAIDHIIKSDPRSDNSAFRAQLRKENISNAVDEQISRVLRSQLRRYKKTLRIIEQATEKMEG
jgi:hypothetical protein